MVILLLFIAFWLGLTWKYSFILFAIFIIALLVFIFLRHGKKILTIAVLFSLFGIGYSFVNIDQNKEQYEGFVYEAKGNYFLFLTGGERLYCYAKENQFDIGDYLTITGYKRELNFAQIESGFDFAQFLNRKGIKYQLFETKITVKFSNPIKIKSYREWFLNHFDNDTKSLINAVLFSNQDESEVVKKISDLHLLKLVSASGIYLHAFLSFLEFLLSFKLKEKWAKVIPLIILLPYAFFTFPRFTVIRVIVMGFARWINRFLRNKNLSNHSLIGLVGLMFLLIDPYLAYQDSFILGFSIPIFMSFINKITGRFKKCPQKILEAICLLIFFIPFELRYYHSLSLLSPVMQIFLTPLFLLLGVSSFFSFCCVPIYPIVNLFGLLVSYSSIPISFLRWEIFSGPMPEWLVTLYYLIYGLFLYYLANGFRIIYRPLGIALMSLIIANFLPLENVISNRVYFINVGQGDACLIREQNCTILIDTGGSIYQDIAKECLIPFFKKKKIYDIDYVITTHDDYDHSGALASLKENFKIGKYINSPEDFPFKYGSVTIKNYNQHIKESSDENEQSLVLGFHFINHDFLVMGDAPISIEKNIMNEYSHVPCDILKIGHHGSDTSTSYSFVKYLDPEVGIVSVGRNYYGHPSSKVLQILNKAGVEIRRTDREGTINYFNYIFM